MKKISRRQFLGQMTAAGSATLLSGLGSAAALTERPLAAFEHGVASGDPLADRVILWTRVSPASADEQSQSAVPVHWQLAADKGFTRVIRQGALTATATRDYTVKTDVDGLEPNHTYYYRFRVGEVSSPVGRTRTLPLGEIASAALAVVSCSNFGHGYFNVCREISRQPDLTAVLHLGDYIYEYGNSTYSDPQLQAQGRALKPASEILSLDDYRQRYNLYRRDTDLQAAHAAHPFICVWDDHEVANDSWRHGAKNHQPDEGDWSQRLSAAVQAYREWLPIRDEPAQDPLRIYRRFDIGNLASLIMLDTRIIGRDQGADYLQDMVWQQLPFELESEAAAAADRADPAAKPRALLTAAELAAVPQTRVRWLTVPFDVRQSPPQPMTDWDQVRGLDPKQLPEGFSYLPDVDRTRAQLLNNPERQLLGLAQEDWLQQQLEDSRQRQIPWQILGQQVLMGSVVIPDITDLVSAAAKVSPEIIRGVVMLGKMNLPYNTDAWDGYNPVRQRVLQTIKAHAANVISLAGDTHNAWAFNLTPDGEQVPVAVEMATASISSPGMEAYFANHNPLEFSRRLVAKNPQLVFQNSHQRGWLTLTLTPQQAQGDWRFVDTVKSRHYTVADKVSYRVVAGQHRLQPV